jgi:hypothetical protein
MIKLKKTHFLIGGFGNQLFQIYNSVEDSFEYSDFFLLKYIRLAFRQTNHETLALNKYKTIPLLNLIILAIDIVAARIFHKSFYTEFDTRKYKIKPIFSTKNKLGYFQEIDFNNIKLSRVEKIFLKLKFGNYSSESVVMHVRAGDYLKIKQNRFGILSKEYYSSCIKLMSDDLIIHTNDEEYALEIIQSIQSKINITIKNTTLHEMIEESFNCKEYIASNSTLSWWIVHFRATHQKPSTVPNPFNKDHSMQTLRTSYIREKDAHYT